MRATVLDLPGSAAIGRELIAGSGLSERVTFRDGDATAADLAASSAADTDGGYDAVLCFNLVHHLTPGEAAALFARIGGVLRPGGTLAVLDVFAQPGRRASAHADLLALFTFLSSGARGHTPADLAAWLQAAGLTPPRKVPLLRIPGLALQVATKPTT
jgi:SAM-dependent methyltransferase